MNRILGLFEKEQNADSAIKELLKAGFDKQHFGLVTRNTVVQKVDYKEDKEQGSIQAESKFGAAGGAAVGGLTGLLVGATTLAIPGVGPVMIAGSLATATGLGAVSGGLLAALTSLGMSEEDAELYSEGVEEGKILLIVDADQTHTPMVKEIMHRTNAVETKIDQQAPQPNAMNNLKEIYP